MKRALVTGAVGFVGRHLSPILKAEGYDVVEVDTAHPSLPCSVERFVSHPEATKCEWDVIVHCAANILDIDARIKGKLSCFDDLTLDLAMCKYVEANPPKECFVVMSSCAAQHPCHEDPYSYLKQMIEAFAMKLHKQGVPVAILRPYSGYGADQASSYPFPALLGRAMRKENPLRIWGSTQTVRDWLHISDLAGAILWAIKSAPRGVPVEIGTGIGITFGELAEQMARAVGYEPEIVADTDKAAGASVRIANTEVAVKHGWQANVNIVDGIRMAIAELSK